MKTRCLFIYRIMQFGIFIVILFNTICVFAQDDVKEMKGDSLRSLLMTLNPPARKLPALKELAIIYRQQEEEVPMEKEILRIALDCDSFHVAYEAMGELARYYYNLANRDSLIYWNNMIDTLSSKRKEYPDALFFARSMVALDYMWSRDYELAMNETILLLRMAEREHQEFGMIRGYKNQAIIYQMVGQDSSAIVAFRKGLFWLDKNRSEDQAPFEMEYLTDMIVSTLHLDLLDEAEQLLIRSAKFLDTLEVKPEIKGYVVPIDHYKCLLNSFFSELYTRKGELRKAKEYLNKATGIVNDSLQHYALYAYYQAEALYYLKTGEEQKALNAVNAICQFVEDPDILILKINILRKFGHYQEATKVCKDMLRVNASLNDEAFRKQINQLRILNNLSDNKKQARELEYQDLQIASKQHQLIILLVTITVLLLLAFLLLRISLRTRRLKDELLREKESLVASENQLRIIKDKAEKANQMKTAFILNISHEVRTPLNAIVGFSELLADDSFTEEEKEGFALTINNSAGLLMNLINDVLELSRLESGNTSFTIKEWDIVVICREVLGNLEDKVQTGVKLIFSPAFDSFLLNTDRFRLMQLLGHLLANGLKFTRKGSVSLSFEVDENNNSVRFIVTDTGCGIPVEMHKKIFERFEKLDEFKQGTGLGLAICQLVAVQLKGSLSIDSSYSEGASFVFVHPCNLESGN